MMRLIKLCLILLLIVLTTFCTTHKTFNFNTDVCRNKLKIKSVNDSTYSIENSGKLLGEIVGGIIIEKSKFISTTGDSIPLYFYIIPPYLNDVYYYNFDDNDYLIFESSITGVSGIAANITLVTILNYKENKFINQFSYSSFCGGASLLKFSKNSISLNVFKYIVHLNDQIDIYCNTNFQLINGKFERKPGSTPHQYIRVDSKLEMTDSSIECEGTDQPYVTNN